MRKEILDFIEYIKAETKGYSNSDFLAKKYGEYFHQEIDAETYKNFIAFHTEKMPELPKTEDFLENFSSWYDVWQLPTAKFFVICYPIGIDNLLKSIEILEEEYELPEETTEKEREYIERKTDLCCNSRGYGYLSTGYGIGLQVNFQKFAEELKTFLAEQEDLSDKDKKDILADMGI